MDKDVNNVKALRLECLKLAEQYNENVFSKHSGQYKNMLGTIKCAQSFYEYITEGKIPKVNDI